MVAINEYMRPTIKEKPFSRLGATAMNSAIKLPDKCSWACHNTTAYCKENHVKLVGNYFEYIDPFYFGLIHLLHKTGNYGVANLVVWVVLIPLIMYVLLIKSLNLQSQIKALKAQL